LFDPYAYQTFYTLNQTLIAEDRLLLGGQSFALSTPAAPTLTKVTTGGTIGAVQVYVGVAARTGYGYFYGGNSRGASASTTFASGTTNSVAAVIPAVKGAVAYDWFVSANGTDWFYYTTSTVSSVTITSLISANNAVPASLADLNATVPTFNASADNGSAVDSSIDGLLATLTGDYTSAGAFVTAGTANANPAVYIDNAGAALTLAGGSITQIEALFAQIYAQVKASPTALMVSAVTAQSIANLVLGSSAAVTFLTTDADNRISTTAGGRVGQVVNTPAGGVTVPIEIHPSLPAGTIIARTDRVPFPQSGISSTLEVRTLRDYSQFDYGITRIDNVAGGGPRKEFEIRSVEAFVNKAPVAMGVLTNVAN
jgi:hypothetical protein